MTIITKIPLNNRPLGKRLLNLTLEYEHHIQYIQHLDRLIEESEARLKKYEEEKAIETRCYYQTLSQQEVV